MFLDGSLPGTMLSKTGLEMSAGLTDIARFTSRTLNFINDTAFDHLFNRGFNDGRTVLSFLSVMTSWQGALIL